jgi:hypothetical protein
MNFSDMCFELLILHQANLWKFRNVNHPNTKHNVSIYWEIDMRCVSITLFFFTCSLWLLIDSWYISLRPYSILLLFPKISTSFKKSIWATVFSLCFSDLWKLNPATAQLEWMKDMANKKFALLIQPHIFSYSYNKSQQDALFLNFMSTVC